MRSYLYRTLLSVIILGFGQQHLSAQNKIEKTYDSLTVEQYLKLVKNEKSTLVYFKADWCVPCVKMEPIIRELQDTRKDVHIIALDVDNNPKVSLYMEINALPLFVIYRKGEKVWENNSYMSAEELKIKIDAYK